MSEIQSFSNSVKGTYSQIKLTDGKKILVSLTKTEITVFKIGFANIPRGSLYRQNLIKFTEGLDGIVPLDDTPILDLIVGYLLECEDIAQVKTFLNSVCGEPDE